MEPRLASASLDDEELFMTTNNSAAAAIQAKSALTDPFAAALLQVQVSMEESQRTCARLTTELARLDALFGATSDVPVFAFSPPQHSVTDAGEGMVTVNLALHSVSVTTHYVELLIGGATTTVFSPLLSLHGSLNAKFDSPDLAIDEIMRRLAICGAARAANQATATPAQ